MANTQQTDPFPTDSTPNHGGSKKDAKSKGGKNKILNPPTIEGVAQLIETGKAKRIIVMAGAGISTAAGIPDFRTPGTGLYDNLQKYNLPYPEAIFDISYFKENPEPFFSLARELYPGKFLPTLTHYFLTLLHRKNLLYRCFTQNIDTLERLAGLPDDMVVEAHGSFARSKCLTCDESADVKWMKENVVDKGKIPICVSCKAGIVKPCITFFGESLPDNFFRRLLDFQVCDLLIVIGTSLQVQPFASLLDTVGEKTPRLLINLEKVGVVGLQDMGFDFDGKFQKYRRDAFYEGTCDEGVKKLAGLCGWEDELLQIYEEGCASLIKEFGVVPTPIDIATKVEEKTKEEKTKEEKTKVEKTKVKEKTKVEPKTRDDEEIDQLIKEFEDKIKNSENSDEVDRMIKEFEEKINLKEKESDDRELLNEDDDTAKLNKEKEELKDKNNKENNIVTESNDERESKKEEKISN